jgi:hypothetical protein
MSPYVARARTNRPERKAIDRRHRGEPTKSVHMILIGVYFTYGNIPLLGGWRNGYQKVQLRVND